MGDPFMVSRVRFLSKENVKELGFIPFCMSIGLICMSVAYDGRLLIIAANRNGPSILSWGTGISACC